MEGVIVNFRRGRKTVRHNEMVVLPKGSAGREAAEKLVGKRVTWKSPGGKPISGQVIASHGNSGAVRARFESGMPGQAIGQKVEIQ